MASTTTTKRRRVTSPSTSTLVDPQTASYTSPSTSDNDNDEERTIETEGKSGIDPVLNQLDVTLLGEYRSQTGEEGSRTENGTMTMGPRRMIEDSSVGGSGGGGGRIGDGGGGGGLNMDWGQSNGSYHYSIPYGGAGYPGYHPHSQALPSSSSSPSYQTSHQPVQFSNYPTIHQPNSYPHPHPQYPPHSPNRPFSYPEHPNQHHGDGRLSPHVESVIQSRTLPAPWEGSPIVTGGGGVGRQLGTSSSSSSGVFGTNYGQENGYPQYGNIPHQQQPSQSASYGPFPNTPIISSFPSHPSFPTSYPHSNPYPLNTSTRQQSHETDNSRPTSAISRTNLDQGIPNGQDKGETSRRGSKRKESGEIKIIMDELGEVVGMSMAKDFVACSTCRRRKIKCDGARPHCLNCTKKSYTCEFDTQLKRRGPDKKPGGRAKKLKGSSTGYDRGGVGVDDVLGGGRDRGTSDASGSGGSGTGGMGGSGGGGMMRIGNMVGHTEVSMGTQNGSTILPTHNFSNPFGMALANIMDPSAFAVPGMQPVPELLSARTISPSEMNISNNFSIQQPNALLLGTSDDSLLNLPFNPNSNPMDVPRPSSSSGSGVEEKAVTPPAIWLDRMPNAAYARESDWLWMTGLFSTKRSEGMRAIEGEMRFFFDLNYLWFSFFNRNLFFSTLHHPSQYLEMQPALVLAMLSVTTLMKTAKTSDPASGRLQACMFADAARSMIQQSMVAQKMDPTLAQAALVLAVFETCPHPQHNFLRVASALKMMDSIIGAFQLLAMDVSDARVSIFVPGDVPRIQQSSTGVISTRTPRPPVLDAGSPENERAAVHTTWSPTPQWPTEWDLAETRKDEARRLCWTASGIVASFSHWQHTLNEAPLDLYLSSPANFALFFEAEAFLIDRDPEAAKSTLWALFHRVILLWHFTVRMAYENSTNSKRNVLAKGILEEAAMIERDLFNVTIDKGDLQKWQSRDWLFTIRTLASSNLENGPSSLLPHFRSNAKIWLTSQAEMAAIMRAHNPISPGRAPDFSSRPFFVWWFIIQLDHALALYEGDMTLVAALVVAQGFMANVESICRDWPSTNLLRYYRQFKGRFDNLLAQKAVLQADVAAAAASLGQV